MAYSKDYKKGWNEALEEALKHAKLIFTKENITFGDRNNFPVCMILRGASGTIYIDRKSIIKLKKR